MNKNFEIVLLPDARGFLEKLDDKTREKAYFNLKKSQYLNDKTLFKKLNEHIWGFRTLYNRKTVRILSFWDKSTNIETLVIATHGFIKKSQKTPLKEIEKVNRIRTGYFNNK